MKVVTRNRRERRAAGRRGALPGNVNALKTGEHRSGRPVVQLTASGVVMDGKPLAMRTYRRRTGTGRIVLGIVASKPLALLDGGVSHFVQPGDMIVQLENGKLVKVAGRDARVIYERVI